MSSIDKITTFYHRVTAYLSRLVGIKPVELTVPLVPELTRFFLSEAIDDRVKFLANVADKQEEDLRPEVNQEYCVRVEEAIRQELRTHSQQWVRFTQLEKDLGKIKLPTQFSDELCSSREGIIGLLRTREVFLPGKLRSFEAFAVFGIFLRALQQVTLEIVRVDYPATSTGTEVPSSTQVVIRKILRRLDELYRLSLSPIELKSPAKAETELRVLVARAKGAACLPLRPIPTSPLASNDLAKHYVGRPDEDALRLARQIRHADGTILVTGYRGVGKSSFVNRVVFHALGVQDDLPPDGWLVVPVTVNLAKVAGVQNILRITLRAVREALLETNSRKARPIPGRETSRLRSVPLPLSKENEIEPLEEAYVRATYKVNMSRSNGSEKKWEAGSSFSIDPGKLLGGSIVGLELGKFLEAGIKKTRTEKINRELSLLDYDENAAEENLARLIRSLATPRPLFGDRGPEVRIKLLFVFDELDKMDVDQGLKPMIEGLKNLFLQQYSVFVLVTSKKFYYDLLKDRAIEDAMLNSYFSAIVHVPLLSYAQARKMVEAWVDWNATEHLKTPSPAETKLIDQLTRVLVYRSFGNPRDIIRELRLMQDWADTTDQPYLTDRLGKSPGLQIFAAIQECIEKTAVPQQSTTAPGTQSDGSVTLVSERLVGDEARLEQIRRGLYILTEELINRGTLLLKARQKQQPNGDDSKESAIAATPAPLANQLEELIGKLSRPAPPSSEPSHLAKIQKDNFSLLSLEDVQELTKRLGGYLSLVHDSPDLFSNGDWGTRRPLFEMQGLELLRVTNDFYALTGRQAMSATAEPTVSTTQKKTVEELIIEAKSLAGQSGWAAKMAAINIIEQVGSANQEPDLSDFLWQVAREDKDPKHRLVAAERLTREHLFQNETDISALLTNETDERVLSVYFRLLGTASDETSRQRATDAIVALLERDTKAPPGLRLTDSGSIAALTVLQTVANRDATSELLAWLCVVGRTEVVQTTALPLLKAFNYRFRVDIADKIISNREALALFTTGFANPWQQLLTPKEGRQDNVLKVYLRELLREHPLGYATKLLEADKSTDVNDLLTYIWDLVFGPHSESLAVYLFDQILNADQNPLAKQRLHSSLRNTAEFQSRMLPYLRKQLPELTAKERFTAEQAQRIDETLKSLESAPEPAPVKSSARDIWQNVVNRVPHAGATQPPGLPLYKKPSSFSSAVFLAGGVLLFLPGLLFYRGDLPAMASSGKVLASRLLLLIFDALITYPIVSALFKAQENVRLQTAALEKGDLTTGLGRTLNPASGWPDTVTFAVLVPIAYAVHWAHTHYIGPLHFWTQVLQFLINWPAIISVVLALRKYRSKSYSSVFNYTGYSP